MAYTALFIDRPKTISPKNKGINLTNSISTDLKKLGSVPVWRITPKLRRVPWKSKGSKMQSCCQYLVCVTIFSYQSCEIAWFFTPSKTYVLISQIFGQYHDLPHHPRGSAIACLIESLIYPTIALFVEELTLFVGKLIFSLVKVLEWKITH